MGNAWEADAEARISDFAKGHGFDDIGRYYLANPTVPLTALSQEIGGLAPIQLRQAIVQCCLANRQMTMFLRDAIYRASRGDKPIFRDGGFSPHGWGAVMMGLPVPYGDLATAVAQQVHSMSLPKDWKPTDPEDELLIVAFDRALDSIPNEMRDVIMAGKTIKQPGDDYRAAIKTIWKTVSICDGPEVFLSQLSEVPEELGLLFAANWCQSEVCNGGFHQFFHNSTGVLAPEAAEGFAAIGMPTCANIIRKAMKFFGTPYPRERDARMTLLDVIPGETKADSDPFYNLDNPFYDALKSENGGFRIAADQYARRIS